MVSANDLVNMQVMLQAKEAEAVELAAEKEQISQRLESADGELFKLRTKFRDIEYLLSSKEELIQDLELRLETQDLTSASAEDEVAKLTDKLSSIQVELADREALIRQLELSIVDKEETFSKTIASLPETQVVEHKARFKSVQVN